MSDGAGRLVGMAGALLRGGGSHESGRGGSGPIDDARLVAALERALAMSAPAAAASAASPAGTVTPVAALAARTIVREARQALADASARGSASDLTDLQYASLEAIVHVIGRPAVRYSNGRIQAPPSDLGENERWTVIIAEARSTINRVSAAVGRVALADAEDARGLLGTAWRAGADLVVTNRHVAAHLVVDAAVDPGQWTLNAARPAVIDFAATDGTPQPSAFRISALVRCAREDDVDVAVLRLATGAAQLPEALTIEAGTVPAAGSEVYVVGHPFRSTNSAATEMVFNAADGRKRWSPGIVTRSAATSSLVEHDCSTLGGNSGSCLFDVATHRVLGIHVGGRGVNDITSRGEANVAVAFGRLARHPVMDLLSR
jgi:hypothetical protein